MTARNKKQPVPTLKPETRKTLAFGVVNTPILATETAIAYLRAPYKDCTDELSLELMKQVVAVNKGDMGNAEGLLILQAHTLNILFHRLLQRAHIQEEMHYIEGFTKLALRAQMQCARTLEALSAIKNPPQSVAFVRQANIAHNQQIHNGTQAGPPAAPAAKNSPPQLEHTHGNYLDTGTVTAACGDDPAMATVGEIHRPEDCRGQG